MIRKSNIFDKQGITDLINAAFGDRTERDFLSNIENGRYFVYELEGKIIAMTGLSNDTVHTGYEIDWTCTHPDYRRNGVMHELFAEMLKDIVNVNIYCSCWRIHDRDKINLYKLMKDFGFVCIASDYKSCNFTNCGCRNVRDCVYYIKNCKCYEDLYMKNCDISE